MATRSSTARSSAALDSALPQKKRARRRLVGAAAICLAAAIVLPLVFDSEPRQGREDIQVSIPSRDTPLTERDAPGASGAITPFGGDAARGENGARGDAARGEAGDRPANGAGAGEGPRADGAGPAGSNGNGQARGTPPAGAASAHELRPEPKAGARADAAPARDGSGDRTEARPATRTEAASAPKVAAEAKPDAKAEPKPDAKAEPKPDAKAEPKADARTAAAKPEARAGSYLLQAGAFASEKSATEQVERVRKAGVKTYTEKIKTAQGERIRVRIGPYPDKDAADRARAKLKAAGIDTVLIAP